jgi:glucosamine kinase
MPHDTRYLLGLDCGGTKTAACILSKDGTELGRGVGGPGNIATGDLYIIAESVRTAVTSAIQSAELPAGVAFDRVCAAVAGYGSRTSRDTFRAILQDIIAARRFRIEPDFMAAYWGASEGAPGVLVSAGTGAVVFARNKRGKTVRVDGRGFLLGDRGSAFSIGRLALVEVLWRMDRGRKLRAFDRMLLEEIGASDPEDIIQWVYRHFEPARIAALGGRVAAWADVGDVNATAILDLPLTMLASSALEAAEALNLRSARTSFYLSGGLWSLGGNTARRIFERRLMEFGRCRFSAAKGGSKWSRKNGPRLEAPRHDPAYGAALLALGGSKHECNKGFSMWPEDT